jgi:hypothetical protein
MFSPLLITRNRRKQGMFLRQVGNRLIVDLLFFALCIMPAGCSFTPAGNFSQPPGIPTRAMVENVPFYAQDELQCGPASLAMALNWSGVSVEPADLTSEVYTPGLKGSLQNSLISSTRRHGRVAYPISGAEPLMTEISAGHPVIVLVNLAFYWYPQWHYAVVIGYDQEQEEVILHSGLTAREVISFWTFNNTWKRGDYWGLIVLPPNRLPELAEESKWIAAVAGLENAGQWQAAATGYATALERWGRSFVAWIGLGNSKYNLKELDSSAEAFYRATQLQPENGLAYNNLAYVLAEQGKREEALIAAQRAVDLGGPFQDTFRQTLDEVKRMEMNKEE